MVGTPSVQVCVGTGTWPEDGTNPTGLVTRALQALRQDRRRMHDGQVDIDEVPPSMVERRRRDRSQPARVLFEGFPQQVSVKAVETPEGLRLRMPLRFLRIGSAVQFDLAEGSTTGVLKNAVLGRTSTADSVPMLYLEVSTASGRRSDY